MGEKQHMTRNDTRNRWFFQRFPRQQLGQRTEYITYVEVSGDDDRWVAVSAAGPVPTQDDYRDQAHAQLLKTAKFDLGCEDVRFTELNEVMPPTRATFEASIGATGCDKKATYRTKCEQAGYAAGKHESSARA
jgi:hypothetical protein